MSTRVELEPAFVLHQRPFRNTSQIVDCLTAGHGVVSIVCRGSRRPGSKYRAILQPFAPLLLSWSGRGEMGNLTGAEGSGPAADLSQSGALAGFYINELSLRLVPRSEPNPEVFSCYSRALVDLADNISVARSLRLFEYRLLKSLGYAPSLDVEAVSGAPIEPEASYRFQPELGPVSAADAGESETVLGKALLSLAREELDEPESLGAAKRILSRALRPHIGERPLRSSAVIKEVLEGA